MESAYFIKFSAPTKFYSLTKVGVRTSSYRVLLFKNFSSFRSSSTVDTLFRTRSYSANNAKCYSACSGVEYHSSKRRSRGPVMAAKGIPQGAEDGKYKHTIDLPKTAFGLRANSVVREPEVQKLWNENQVFNRVASQNTGGSFVLHDGPPYANGDLHMGHALNKILKDIINRYKSLDQDARKEMTPLKLRAKAAKFAKSTVKNQMEQFKRYGIWADWDNPYLTLDPEYEAAQIEVFGQMTLQGYIYRGRKPVHWSPSSRTALAEAELEYPGGHVSKSIYAVFRLVSIPTSCKQLNDFIPNLSLAIWTTTPWTIPANAAVAVNSKLQYAVVEVDSRFVDITALSTDKEKKTW